MPPNVVVVYTDDQDSTMGSMRALPWVSHELAARGAVLDHFYANTPMCCPSRAEMLSGRHFHNLKLPSAATTRGSCMHVDAGRSFHERRVFVGALADAGYRVGYFGKYLNAAVGEGMEDICPATRHASAHFAPPPGWDPAGWLVMCPDTCYSDCSFATAHGLRTFDDARAPRGSNYATSVIGNATLAWMRTQLAARRPFVAFAAPHAPHEPAVPAR
jgi:arylsulfatase A-like enzyme